MVQRRWHSATDVVLYVTFSDLSLTTAIIFGDGRAVSPTGCSENGFLHLRQSEMPDLLKQSCPSRKSYPRVLMMQAGQNGRSDNSSASLDRPLQRRILVQR
jgi:hypothetical protein